MKNDNLKGGTMNMKNKLLIFAFVFSLLLVVSFGSAMHAGSNTKVEAEASVDGNTKVETQVDGGAEIGTNGSVNSVRNIDISTGKKGNQAAGETDVRVRAMSGGGSEITSEKISAKTGMEISLGARKNDSSNGSEKGSRMRADLSNGKHANIKVMPHQASEKALEQLRLNVCSEDCTIELREVGSGNETHASYEVNAQKESRVLGLFKKKMDVSTKVDAETGEVTKTKKPWWAFLASESKAKSETEVNSS